MKHESESFSSFFQIFNSSSVDFYTNSIKIQDFHFGAFHLLINSIHATCLIISPPDLFRAIEEYLNPSWEYNFGLSFPDLSLLPSSPEGFIPEDEKQRQITKSIIQSLPKDVRFILTTEAALEEKCFIREKRPPFIVDKNSLFELMVDWLISADYTVEEIVLTPGTYSIRGGIIDVFPISSGTPVRINFLSEEVEIFTFNIETQLTTGKLLSTKIPAVDILQEGGESFSDIFKENFIKIHVLSENTISVGNSSSFLRNIKFSFYPLSLKEFLSFQNKNSCSIKTNNSLTVYGFLDENLNCIIPPWFKTRTMPDAELTSKYHSSIIDFDKIEPGDILIHNDYGLCRYLGLRQDEENRHEYILLEFEDNGFISLSVKMIRKLSYYASSNQSGIVLDSLTKLNTWKRKKASAQKSAEEIVEKLLLSYAERSSAIRNPYQLDTEIEKIFISQFPYADTTDQTLAWNEISQDLSFSSKPMNRLLCGDVGFGKTEIAVRASFRAVYNGLQVAVLAPTTILVNQLFSTFNSRLEEFDISIEMVSRFRSRKDIKDTLNRLSSGNLDIVIGTHSLLSDNIVFANLGLLIIDEEQRFGVNQKEKIQELQKNIDLLSMSATPIPRTLHLAKSGIKDISTLQTPPVSRHPIHTQISYFDINTIKRTILNEVRREGQVYFVHNEVKSIGEIYGLLSEHLPLLKISVAHGQQAASTLEKTIVDFQNKKIDVLICSSIIETGIDIPNTNTIIINRAHRFGLAQLHQIRGRVGRSHRKAFALLLIPKGMVLNKNSSRRLKAIEKHSGLGEGYNLSMMDLEIRGAGTVFGYRQSGGAGRVGSELYTQLINQAINKQLNPDSLTNLDPDQISINIYNDGSIPVSYIQPPSIRLDFYRKLAQSNTIDEILEIEYALENRFGSIPQLLQHLIFETKTRIHCCVLGIDKVNLSKGILMFEFIRENMVSNIEILLIAVNNYFSYYKFKYWYKEEISGKFKIFISGILPEDIPSTISNFFDKLYDAYKK